VQLLQHMLSDEAASNSIASMASICVEYYSPTALLRHDTALLASPSHSLMGCADGTSSKRLQAVLLMSGRTA
jgi:hypothetical protein